MRGVDKSGGRGKLKTVAASSEQRRSRGQVGERRRQEDSDHVTTKMAEGKQQRAHNYCILWPNKIQDLALVLFGHPV